MVLFLRSVVVHHWGTDAEQLLWPCHGPPPRCVQRRWEMKDGHWGRAEVWLGPCPLCWPHAFVAVGLDTLRSGCPEGADGEGYKGSVTSQGMGDGGGLLFIKKNKRWGHCCCVCVPWIPVAAPRKGSPFDLKGRDNKYFIFAHKMTFLTIYLQLNHCFY